MFCRDRRLTRVWKCRDITGDSTRDPQKPCLPCRADAPWTRAGLSPFVPRRIGPIAVCPDARPAERERERGEIRDVQGSFGGRASQGTALLPISKPLAPHMRRIATAVSPAKKLNAQLHNRVSEYQRARREVIVDYLGRTISSSSSSSSSPRHWTLAQGCFNSLRSHRRNLRSPPSSPCHMPRGSRPHTGSGMHGCSVLCLQHVRCLILLAMPSPQWPVAVVRQHAANSDSPHVQRGPQCLGRAGPASMAWSRVSVRRVPSAGRSRMCFCC